MYGWQVDRGRLFSINQNTGVLTLIDSSLPRDYRGDNAPCYNCGTGNSGFETAEITVCPTETTTYTVKVTDANGCMNTKTVTVKVNTLPVVNITGNLTLCVGQSTTLTATGGDTFRWSTGETTYWITVNPLVTTTYSVTVNDGNNCSASTSVTVVVNPLPTPTITGTSEICVGDTGTLTASGGVSYVWSTGATTASINVSPTVTTTYIVTATDSNGCTVTASSTVTVNPLPVVNITGKTDICVDECTTLTATGGETYSWSGVSGGGFTCDGSYFVGGLQNGAPQSLFRYNAGGLSEIGPLGTNWVNAMGYYCGAGNQPELYALRMPGTDPLSAIRANFTKINPLTGAATVLGEVPQPPNLYGQLGITGIINYVADISKEGIYYFPAVSALINPLTFEIIDYTIYLGKIDVNDHGNGANVSYEIISVLPNCKPYMDACIEAFQRFALDPSSGEPSGGIQDWALSPDGKTLYSYFGIENALFTLNLQNLAVSCQAGPESNSVYTGQTGAQTDEFGGIYFENNQLYGWQVDRGRLFSIDQITAVLTLIDSSLPRDYRGDNAPCYNCGTGNSGFETAEITVCPTETTTYTVKVTDANGCMNTKTVTVTVNPKPEANITGTLVVCLGESTVLTASGGSTYLWSTGSVSPSITVSPTENTVYSVTVTDNAGCSAVTSRTVTVRPLPVPQIIGNTTICLGENTFIGVLGGVSIVWSTGSTSVSINVSPVVTTTYTATITDANGCSAIASVEVVVLPLPTPIINGSDEICTGSEVILTATGGSTYVWNTGATTSSITVYPATTTTYTVTATDANGCSATAVKTITVNPLPQATITGGTIICLGESTTLTASGGNNYIWSNGAITSAITVSPLTTTTYSVTVNDGNNCISTATVTVVVNPLPVPMINGDSEICVGETVTLTASGGVSYVWSSGVTTASITVNPALTTLYSVTTTDANGCNATTSFEVVVHPLPTPLINGLNEICTGSEVILTATGGSTYIWNTGATTSSITVNPASTTTYSVTTTDVNGCTGIAVKTVIVNPLPIAVITGGTTICLGESTTLTASGGTNYVWSNGAITSAITISPLITTTYTVTVNDGNNCSATTSVMVTVNPLPTPQITGSSEICIGSTGTLTASGGVSYVWSTGAVTTSINVTPAITTTYTVTATDSNGCTGVASNALTVNPLPIATISGNNAVCLGSSITLIVAGGVSYTWSTGETTSSIIVSPVTQTTYTVTVTDANGCISSTSKTVNINALPIVSISGNNNICEGETAIITATGGVSYIWSNGSLTASISVNPSTSTTYTVTATDVNGCTASSSFVLNIKAKPAVFITGNDQICKGDRALLVATGSNLVKCDDVCDVSNPEVLAYWDMEACVAVMNLGSHFDYTELTAKVSKSNCAGVTASNAHRLNGPHSCNPGPNDGIGMCFGSQNTCNSAKLDFSHALRFRVTLSPIQNGEITGLQFFEQSPVVYEWIGGTAGPNDYATKYALRVSKNGTIIYYQDEIPTSRTWGLANFNFASDPNFSTKTTADFLFELVPYCRVGNGAIESVWDIDEIKVLGGCCNATSTEITAYKWSDGSTKPSIFVTPTETTTYTVTATDCCGCVNTASYVVEVNCPNADLGPDLMVNFGESVTLTPVITGASGCNQDCTPDEDLIISWDMDQCNAANPSEQKSFSEFSAKYPNENDCVALIGYNIMKPQGVHECTDGSTQSGSAIRIAAAAGCNPSLLNSSGALRFAVTVDPGDVGQIHKFSFYEKSSSNVVTSNGDIVSNNFITKVAFRAYKEGHLVYENYEIASGNDWNQISIDFASNPAFKVTERSIFVFEIFGYCGASNGAQISVWDIDNVSISGGCCTSENNDTEGLKYLWSTGETTPSITVSPVTSSFYRVTVTDCKECKDTESISIHVNMAKNLVIFPNPAYEKVNLVSKSKLDPFMKVRLYSVDGKEINAKGLSYTVINETHCEVHLPTGIPAGVVILEIDSYGITESQKILILNR
ncbi:MAG: T9SS type A sorting domain-containing protein [Saprospiraceae bacterium]|nr:T9SS type A sorting domain-containing protein [Saprospiraceae bacterium]